MTNNEILQKVIRKAQKNGFYFDKLSDKSSDTDHNFNYLDVNSTIKVLSDEYINCKNLINIQVDNQTCTWMGLYDVIFSHDFAKAFWGEILKDTIFCPYCLGKGTHRDEGLGYEVRVCPRCEGIGTVYWPDKKSGWRYHLQQMILEEKPLKYLEKFYKETK